MAMSRPSSSGSGLQPWMEEALSSRENHRPEQSDPLFFRHNLAFDGIGLLYLLLQLVFSGLASMSCTYRCDTLLFSNPFETRWPQTFFIIGLLTGAGALSFLCTYKTVSALQQQWAAASGLRYFNFILLDAAQFAVRITALPTLKPVLSPKDGDLGNFFMDPRILAPLALVFAILLFSVELSVFALYWVYTVPIFRDDYEPLAQCDPLGLDVIHGPLSSEGPMESAYRMQARSHVNGASSSSETDGLDSPEGDTSRRDSEVSPLLLGQTNAPAEVLSDWVVGFSEYHSTWDPDITGAARVVLFMVLAAALLFTIDTAVKLVEVLRLQEIPEYSERLRDAILLLIGPAIEVFWCIVVFATAYLRVPLRLRYGNFYQPRWNALFLGLAITIVVAALFDLINTTRVFIMEWEQKVDQRHFFQSGGRFFLVLFRISADMLTVLLGYTPLKLGSYLEEDSGRF